MTRTPAEKTLIALDHHAAKLKDIALAIWMIAAEKGYSVRSVRGGANSWNFTSPKGVTYKFRGRLGTNQIEVYTGSNLVAAISTRAQVREFFRTR